MVRDASDAVCVSADTSVFLGFGHLRILGCAGIVANIAVADVFVHAVLCHVASGMNTCCGETKLKRVVVVRSLSETKEFVYR